MLSNDYYPALARPNVELVADGIKEVRPHSVVTNDGVERKVDALIYGTGFRGTDRLSPTRVVGRDGACLNDAWRAGVEGSLEAYLGMTVSGYPNWFMLLGPNSAVGHNSMVFVISTRMDEILCSGRASASNTGRAPETLPRPILK